MRVLELASVLAGPAVGMFLAELGADVIKIENKRTGGDVTRIWKTIQEDRDDPESAYYQSVNWGKSVEFLDLKNDSDLSRLFVLIAQSDIVLMNFRPDDAKRYGLNPEALRIRYPKLIIGQVTGFSDENRVAYDAVLQAESGIMSLNGEPWMDPLKLPVAFIDLFAAHQLKEAILLALYMRERTGEGAHVKVALFDAAVASLANQASVFLNTGVSPKRMGSLHPSIAPYGEVFRCADRQCLLIACGTDAQFSTLCQVLNHEELSHDPRFSSNPLRVANRSDLEVELARLFSMCESDYILNELIQKGVPAGKVRELSDVFDLPEVHPLILEEPRNGKVTKRVSTAVFKINPQPC